ncbi:MAG: hypothetical protein AB1726_00315 [Planctomycetota bacterium]
MQRTLIHRRSRSPRAGATLIEAVAGMGVVLLSMVGFARVVLFADLHPEADHEYLLAREAVQRTIDDLSWTSFREVYARYNEDPFDDPDGAGTASGDRFSVPGLAPRSPDPETAVGRISFPTIFDFDCGLALREDVLDPALGMPRDLNGDGQVDRRDHSRDYALLPVRVRVEWRGAAGPSVLEVETLIGDL